MRSIIANVTAAACCAVMLMLLLVQPGLLPAGPHGAAVESLIGRHQDLQYVVAWGAR